MGLDMYLTKRTDVKRWSHQPEEEKFLVTVTRGGAPFPAINPERVAEIIEEVAYWRKANQIHAWFVRECQGGVDDCKEYYVSRVDLTHLLETVNTVLADRSSAMELLPPQPGFFFGPTELDEWYWQDLEFTRDTLTALLAEPDERADFYYQSSW